MNNNVIQVANNNAEVEKLAGKIKAQIIPIGIIIGKKPVLKSFIVFCFKESKRATYIIRASFAKSEV